MNQEEEREKKIEITYPKLFWLFIAGSILGMLLEGVFSYFKRGAWETHVVSVWGPFCIIYGIGLAACYAGYAKLQGKSRWQQFWAFGLGGCLVELVCGTILDRGLHMRAWNYTHHFMNFHGYISPSMIFVWGIVGLVFSHFIPHIDSVLDRMQGPGWNILCALFSLFMAVNLVITGTAIARWSCRHFGRPAANRIERAIDHRYDDHYMEKRFCEWEFID